MSKRYTLAVRLPKMVESLRRHRNPDGDRRNLESTVNTLTSTHAPRLLLLGSATWAASAADLDSWPFEDVFCRWNIAVLSFVGRRRRADYKNRGVSGFGGGASAASLISHLHFLSVLYFSRLTTKFTTVLSALALGALSHFATAAPTAKEARDIWDPKMIFPDANTVWYSGHTYTVIWDTDDKPAEVTSFIGSIALRVNGIETPFLIAEGFNLTDGHVNVVAPLVDQTADFYSLVLFGDSGNNGPDFTIVAVSE